MLQVRDVGLRSMLQVWSAGLMALVFGCAEDKTQQSDSAMAQAVPAGADQGGVSGAEASEARSNGKALGGPEAGSGQDGAGGTMTAEVEGTGGGSDEGSGGASDAASSAAAGSGGETWQRPACSPGDSPECRELWDEACSKLSRSECEAEALKKECHSLLAQRVSSDLTCIEPGDSEWVGCGVVGCTGAPVIARDPAGDAWLFSNGCIPWGWIEVNVGWAPSEYCE